MLNILFTFNKKVRVQSNHLSNGVENTSVGILLALLAFAPFAAVAQDRPTDAEAGGNNPAQTPTTAYNFMRQGIFDCNLNGAYAMSVGAMAATSGVYVPVADATVELNTGIIVYKECVLREVVNREREAAMEAYFKKAYVGVQTGRGGNPQYVVDQRGEELSVVMDPTMLRILQGGALQPLNPSFKDTVTRAVARTYETRTRASESALACSYDGDLNGELTAPTRSFSWEGLEALAEPACNPLGAYYLADDLASNSIAQALAYQRTQWDWGRGYYSVVDGNGNIVTPAVNVQESFQKMLNSPVEQLQSANDIGQMIGALYAGISTQIISDNRGLAGLSRGVGGQASYLDQASAESSQGLRNAASNVAIQSLVTAQRTEASYFQKVNAIASALTQTILQLRSAESQCWNLIIPKVCSTSLAADNTCTSSVSACTGDSCGTGSMLKVATSTTFSQPIIDARIKPLAADTGTNINVSQNALRLIDQMIQGVTNTASSNAQLVSIRQLDSLVAQHLLHIPPDVTTVTQQLDSVQAAMTTLVTNTIQGADGTSGWANSPTVRPGWCNVNNTAVVDAWKKCWDKNNPDRSACPTP